MDDPFTITLIRHLPTNGNREKKYIGWTDESIISGIKTKKTSTEINQVTGSDLVRCKQTAEQLFHGIPYVANANFRECSFGDWEEKTYNELKEDTFYKAWLENPREVAPPNGESLANMEERVLKGFYDVVEKFELPVIVTHGGPTRFLLTKFADVEKSFWNWDVPHGCMYKLQWKDKKDVLEGKRCMSFSVEHLMESALM
ncbi:histidine phosphatase family protein [Psychrobacillus glaciei]|uniref:Histidine phosphatase family protein n=1 Tax=Psychrobacillus glaciei TaxID=2283160 RepID=A0A5J6STA5_9BACI|nr:histidine phosphatase family protein [Psychrobacillus glaciei]QFG01081.1 histidine phosphatase family protein [Psychrobacillus glaciei]